MKKIFAFIVFELFIAISKGQNFILNPDFELFSQCPVDFDEVFKCNNWISVVSSPDYYDCSFTSSSAYPSSTNAYSGTGFMGFAAYDANGSSEAIGQNLSQPLLPGLNYSLSFACKKTDGGSWSSSCGGMAVYGFKQGMPSDALGIHISQVAGAVMLGTTPVITNVSWELFKLDFSPMDTIHQIAFTVEHVPNCFECLFLDSINLSSDSTTGIDQSTNASDGLYVSPNPASDYVFVKCNSFRILFVTLENLVGEKLLSKELMSNEGDLSLKDLAPGLYLIMIELENETSVVKKIEIN
jgi:hypothetical protein